MLINLREVLKIGKDRNIAIGSFNTPNLECLLAVLGAAEKLDVPVIIMHAQVHEKVAPIEEIGKVMLTLAKKSKTKVCVHLDHGEDEEYCRKAIDMGFTSVMYDNSTLPYEENVKRTRNLTYYAHCNGVSVEAELGALPQREGGGGPVLGKKEDLYTDPEKVPDFVRRTGVDALAIAFGTAHGIYKEKPVLNMDIISKVRERTDIPLVMHGGSGISDDEYKEVIRRGISKINYYTYMSYAGYAAAKEQTDESATGFYHELALRAQIAMSANVEKTLRVFSAFDRRK